MTRTTGQIVECRSELIFTLRQLALLGGAWLCAVSTALAQPAIVINVPPGPVGTTAGFGTQVNVLPGGQLVDSFRALAGSDIRVLGGEIGNYFRADFGSSVSILQGKIGSDATFNGANLAIEGGEVGSLVSQGGSRIDMSGGVLGHSPSFAGGTFNLSGGVVGGFGDVKGATINVTGGEVRYNLYAWNNDRLNVSGGAVNGIILGPATILNASGGTIGALRAESGSVVNIRGGTIRDGMLALTGSKANIYGGDFRVNGVPVAGLTAPGDSAALNFLRPTVLSGVLPDGSVFSLLASAHGLSDDLSLIEDGVLRVTKAAVPAAAPAVFRLPTDAAPPGLRTGQTLIVESGGVVPKHFNAAWGTTVEIGPGAIVDDDFESVGSVVNISGGTIGASFGAFHGDVVNVTGGTFGKDFMALGAQVTASDGEFSNIYLENSVLNVSGAFRGSFGAGDNSIVNMTGGVAEDESAVGANAIWNLSGGTVGEKIRAVQTTNPSNSNLRIHGNDFRINGQPVASLANEGDSSTVNFSNLDVFTGVLADGTPFLFSGRDGDLFTYNAIVATVSLTAPTGPAVIKANVDAVPLGVRDGQTIVVSSGAEVAPHFNAGRGSVVEVEAGGSIGRNLELAGAALKVSGGVVGDDADVFLGSDVQVSGGSLGKNFAVLGSVMRMTGGTAQNVSINEGSLLEFSGGTIEVLGVGNSTATIEGGIIGAGSGVGEGGTVNVKSGVIGSQFSVGSGGVVHIQGGSFGDEFSANSGAVVHLYGDEFRVNGQLVAGLDAPDSTVTLAQTCCVPISAVLADGTPFNHLTAANGSDYFAPGSTVVFHAAELPAVGAAMIRTETDVVPAGIRGGQTLLIGAGTQVGSNFQAGWGSNITIEEGGAVESNLEAIGANVNVYGGAVGPYLDIAYGTLNIFGGSIDHHAKSHAGSIVNIFGGHVGGFYDASNGSIVNVKGGVIDGVFDILSGSVLNLQGGQFDFDRFGSYSGSTLNLFGREFFVDGVPLTGLSADSSTLFKNRNVVLSGLLADGTPFSFRLSTTRDFSSSYFSSDSNVTITLATVPEPNALILGAVALCVICSTHARRRECHRL